MNPSRPLFLRLCQREWLLQARTPYGLLFSVLFFLMITVFFPLTMPPDPGLMRTLFPGIVWISVLLAVLLESERLFKQDYDEGVIEQWLVSGESLYLAVGAKLLVHWVLLLALFSLLCPVFAVFFHLSVLETGLTLLCLLLGTPALITLCALAAAFCTGLDQKGGLVALILFPLALPVMIFGSGTLQAGFEGLAVSGHFALLAAFSLLAAGFLPVAIAAVIRISMAE